MQEVEGVLRVDAHAQGSYPLSDKEWNLPRVPRDQDNFVQSFEPDQVEAYQKV
jgi:hypothetical protein